MGSPALSAERIQLIARIGELRASGLSMAEIGAEVGESKNLVIGLLHRHSPKLVKPLRNGLLERLDLLHRRMDALTRSDPLPWDQTFDFRAGCRYWRVRIEMADAAD